MNPLAFSGFEDQWHTDAKMALSTGLEPAFTISSYLISAFVAPGDTRALFLFQIVTQSPEESLS